MWLITGPFDSAQSSDELPQKTKLLSTNRVYDVGRHQDNDLYINNKRISRQNGQFVVGEHSEDDVSNEALVPTLSFRNNKTMVLTIVRGKKSVAANPKSMHELESGDVVGLTHTGSITATVTWEPTVCFYNQANATPTFDLAAFASMGVKLVTKHSRDVTHHLTPTLSAPLPPPVLYSLLTPARFVKPDWALELMRIGPDLEKTYEPLNEKGFCPVLDETFSGPMSKKGVWDPNDARKSVFEDMKLTFVVLGSGAGSLSKAMADVVTRGGASRQLINVEKVVEEQAKGTAGTWGTVLKKRKLLIKEGMGSGLVLVGEADTMTARGVPKEIRDAWEAMVDKAKSVNMRIVHPSLISEAIVKADASILDCVVKEDPAEPSSSKSFPDHIPSTHPEEPSQPPIASQTSGAGPSRRLIRRVTSQTPAPEPAPPVPMEVEEEINAPAPPPRKLLKRRAKTGGIVNELLGLDDSTVLLEAPPSQPRSQSQETGPPAQGQVPPTPARSGRLKRRAGTAVANSQLFPGLEPDPPAGGAEPTLKKFKALFEESGQGVKTQTDETSGGSDLMAVREEEEEEESQSQMPARKRKVDAMEEVPGPAADVEMQEREDSSTAHKRRAIENVNAVEPSQHIKAPISAKPASRTTVIKGSKSVDAGKTKGADPGKPDTDPFFLRAIASTKRGKKTEDEFDREFNKLRIAKPDINNTNNAKANASYNGGGTVVQWEKEWDGLGDFEKDVGVRGNFMEIHELQVWKQDQDMVSGRNIRRESGLGARMDWDGREDFKKFRRKMDAGTRESVQLVVTEQADYGTSDSYWESKGDKSNPGFSGGSQSQDQPKFTQTQAGSSKSRTNSQLKPKPKPKHTTATFDESDESDGDKVPDHAMKSKRKTQATAKGKASQVGKKAQPLFEIGSEDDMDTVGPSAGAETIEDDDAFDSTPPSTMKTTQAKSQKGSPTRGTKRKAIVVEDSDSEGVTFGGFSKKAKKSAGLRAGR